MTTFCKALETSAFHIVGCSEAEIDNLVRSQALTLPSDCVIRLVRGQRCQTKHSLFQEFAASLQFPYYFGQNWDGFDECLSDLEWLPARTYILVISSADRLLMSANQDLHIFCNVVSDATTELAHPSASSPQSRPVARLIVVLQVDQSILSQTQQRFSAAGLVTIRSDELFESQSAQSDEG